MPQTFESETRQLGPQSIEARVQPSTLNQEARTVEVVASTGAAVRRYDWRRGVEYDEILDISRDSMRLERLQSGGAPFLESHNQWDVDAVIGTITDVRIANGELRTTIRFHETERAEELFQRVRRDELPNVSVGYRTWSLEREYPEGADEVEVRRATDWEPYEVSLVSIGADADAGTRAAQPETNPCTFRTAIPAPATAERTMPEQPENTPQSTDPTPSEGARASEPQPTPTATQEPPVDVEAVRAEAIEQERQRAADISGAVTKAGLPGEFARGLIDQGMSLDQARAAIIDEVAETRGGPETTSHVRVGDEDHQKRNQVAEHALHHRVNPGGVDIAAVEGARDFAGMTLMEIGSELAMARGMRVRGLNKMERAAAILNLGTRGQSTSDFPLLLSNVVGKTLRKAYDESPQTWRPIVSITEVPDFKEVSRNQMGEAPALEPVGEGGEYPHGSFGEAQEKYAIGKYGKIVCFTRETLINDDLGAFSRTVTAMGKQASNLESDIVWGVITANAAMADGDALFHANHGNVGAGVIGSAGLTSGRLAMRTQKGLDGETHLNIRPSILVIPAALETEAEKQVVLQTAPTTNAETNPFRGTLQVIAEPRLDVTSAAQWYLFTSPGAIDTIELAFLQGNQAPYTESREGFDVDGVEFKIRHELGAKAIDWRGMYRSSGV